MVVKNVPVAGDALAYEGLVSGIVAPKGIVVHPRVHDFEIVPTSDGARVQFVNALHVEPGVISGGKVRLTVSLVERRGLANTIAKKSSAFEIRIIQKRPAPPEVAADFYGYRYYRRLAQRRRASLEKSGLRLSLKDEERLPPLNRAPTEVTQQVFRFARERRLMWVAQRHLVAAVQHPDPEIRQIAQAYLRNLDRPRQEWSGVPTISVLGPASADRTPPRATKPPGGPRASGQPPEKITRLEPDSERPDSTGESRDPARPERLEPSAEYELGTERPLPPPPDAAPRAEAEPPAAPEPGDRADDPSRRRSTPAEEDSAEIVYETDTFADQPIRRVTRIPSYYRGLVFEDPNIAHGAAIRASIASIETRESADTAAIFYFAQAALNRVLGVELTIPTQYIDITSFPGDRNPPAQYEIGNPLLALKYRLQLPKIGGRRPALTLKARWGIPIAPLHGVPATELIVEEFTREVNFTDTYAFFLENHDLGLGASFVWQWRWLYTGFQLFGDLFIPVGGATQDATFGAIGYGATVGALPFGDWVGFFVEGRGTSLLLGGGRNEFFVYAGARGRFLDWLEPALWVGVPLGSIQQVSPVQVGLEIRFSYDIDDIIEPRIIRRDDILEQP